MLRLKGKFTLEEYNSYICKRLFRQTHAALWTRPGDQQVFRSSLEWAGRGCGLLLMFRSMDFLDHLQQHLIGKCDALCAGMLGFRNKTCLKGKILIIPWWWKHKTIAKGSSALLAPKVCWTAGGHLSHVHHMVFLYSHLCFSLLTEGNSCKEPAPLDLFKALTWVGSHH